MIWECELKATRIEQTMRAVELRLNQCFLDIHSRKVRQYSTEEDAELPAAAEEAPKYGKSE